MVGVCVDNNSLHVGVGCIEKGVIESIRIVPDSQDSSGTVFCCALKKALGVFLWLRSTHVVHTLFASLLL